MHYLKVLKARSIGLVISFELLTFTMAVCSNKVTLRSWVWDINKGISEDRVNP